MMFKRCTKCQTEWDQCQTFLRDKTLTFQGYQPHFRDPERGLFLFNHLKMDCNTTLSIQIEDLRGDLLPNAPIGPFVPGGEGCPRYCDDHSNLEPCGNLRCNGHLIREMIQIIKKKMTS